MSFFKDVESGTAADITFLVDPSWSTGEERFRLVREFLCDVVEALAVGESDFRFALVQFDGSPPPELLLSTFRPKQEVLSHISNMSYPGGSNQTGAGGGLGSVTRGHLPRAAGSRAGDGVPQVLVVITDGRAAHGLALPSSARRGAADVNVFAVGLEDADEAALRDIASDPGHTHVFRLENVTALADLVGNLVSLVHLSVALGRAGGTEAPKDVTGNGHVAELPPASLVVGEDELGNRWH